MLDKKPLTLFLILTFGVTLILIFIARWQGLTLGQLPPLISQFVILGAMFVPAISAIIVQKFVCKKPLKELGFRWGPWRMYGITYAIVLLMFVINYAVTWLFILPPDLSLNAFLGQFAAVDPNLQLPLPAYQMIIILALLTFLGAPVLNMIPSLGEEIGWRGFLLPALEPLGKLRASILSGMIWALWHTPMILILGFAYGEQAWLGFLLHFILVTSLGIWMGYVWFQTRSTVLAAFIHSVFNANAYGVWAVIFISSNKLLVGSVGLINTILFLCVGLITAWKMRGELSVTKKPA